MGQRRRHLLVLAVAASVALGVTAAGAQVLPPLDESTTTTSTPSTTTTTAPSTTTTTRPGSSSSDGLGELDGGDSTEAPAGSSTGEDGDGTAPPSAAQRIGVPAEAQRIIDSVVRSGPSDSRDLDAAMAQLVELGLSSDEAYRAGFGRFIIAGPATYSHDWLYPRYGPGFRFHLGTDVFAPYGTPVRAPVDGVAEASTNSLGGLATKVYMADGTYFYMAHLSGVPESLAGGQVVEVRTGDIVGYVGDSGNAKGTSPHVHLGIYPQGGAAIDPKPILDRFLDDARTRLPDVLAYYQQQAGTPAATATSPAPVPDSRGRALLSTALLRPLSSPVTPPGVVPTEVLFASTVDPTGGAIRIAGDEAALAASSIDWEERQFLEEVRVEVLDRGEALLRTTLTAFVDPASGDTIARGAVRGG